jgi:hypothetical protein
MLSGVLGLGAIGPTCHCSQTAAPEACIGDTVHEVLRRAYTWPNVMPLASLEV